MLVNILLLILIVVRLMIGVRLLITGRNNHLPNLIWLSVNMFVTAIGLLFSPTVGNPLGNLPFSLWVFMVGAFVTLIPIIIFNQLTFYKNRKSPAIWVWTVFIILLVLTVYGMMISESNYNQSAWVAAYVPGTVLIWAWHGWLAREALHQVASEPSVQPWVKTRYQLIIFYSIALIVAALASFVRIVFAGGSALSTLGSLTGLIAILAQITSVTLMFLVWVMPEPFRLWLNREQRAHSENEHPLSVLDVFGAAMTDNTGLQSIACLYAIRATVAKRMGTEDSAVVRYQINTMSYNEWETILKHPELRRILINSGASAEASVKAIENAQKALVDKQSLLTLRTH